MLDSQAQAHISLSRTPSDLCRGKMQSIRIALNRY